MAVNGNYRTLFGLTANADLSSNQFFFVKLASTAGKVVAPGTLNTTTSAAAIIGVLGNKPASGEEVEFIYDGVVKVVANTSTIAIGDRVYSNTTGKATDAGATDNGFFVGRAVTASAAANDIITVILNGANGSRF